MEIRRMTCLSNQEDGELTCYNKNTNNFTIMALVDLDKFVASMMEHYCHAHNIDRSVTRCWIDCVLEDQGLEYEDGKIVKNQRRISAEAKENGYGESEDERIRKAMINIFATHKDYEVYFGVSVEDIRVWLEKQGGIDNCPLEFSTNTVMTDSKKNQVKSKFKIGDWVVDNCGYVWKIEEVLNQFNLLEGVEGGESRPTIEWVNETFHLWSIEDAKPGDVLAEDSCIFIIQKLGDNNTAAKTYCTLYDDGDFDDGTILYFDIDSTKPATKEQRNTLFAKMHEAGYMWDSKIKQLLSLKAEPSGEQKPAWSEDDDDCLSIIIAEFSKCAGKSVSKDAWMRCNDFLNSLKDRVQSQPKQELDEDTQQWIDAIIKDYEGWYDADKDHRATIQVKINILKSIMPQTTWKPSNEQMKVLLSEVTGWKKGCPKQIVLESLYNDLKKLK